MKGIGKMNAAAIVSEMGDITQFHSVLKLQSYGGKCPDMAGSGGKSYAKRIDEDQERASFQCNSPECSFSGEPQES